MAVPFESAVRDFGRRLRSRVLRLRGNGEEAAMLWSWTVPGWSTKEELRALYRAVLSAKGPGDVAEIGSWKGRSTIVIANALRDAGIEDARIWAIDHHVGSDEDRHRVVLEKEGSTLDAFRENLAHAGVARRVEPLVMSSKEAAVDLGRRGVSLRLVFIDGAHDEESVRADIRAFVPLLRSGGVIALHDCDIENANFPGVWNAYRTELEPDVDLVEHADSLLVVRLKQPAAVV